MRQLEPMVNSASRSKQAAIKGTLGQAYFCAEDCEKATPLLEEYIKSLRDPEYALYYQVGYCSYKSGQYEKAITYLKELTSANSDSMRQHAMYMSQSTPHAKRVESRARTKQSPDIWTTGALSENFF